MSCIIKEKFMDIERIKQMISKSIFLKALLTVLLIAILFFYFRTFFATGVYFDDTFLKKEVVSSDSHYIGKSIYGDIHITVKGLKNKHSNVDVIYRLPNNINRQYTVSFKDAGNWELGIENIKDEDDKIVFEGEYRKDSFFLFDKNGQPLMEDIIRIRINGDTPYNGSYKVPLKSVADFASFANDTIRGKYKFLVPAIFLFVLTLIDIKFPLFFFTLKHLLDVKDPEPSDFYIMMQRISWYVYPIIGVILMIVAIN